MQFSFSYNKKKVIQGLRYHFISKREIKLMLILVNVFAILSAILYYSNKIRPEAFLLGSFIWILMMTGVWYILPYTIFKKSTVFKDQFILYYNNASISLENEKGSVAWYWTDFSKYFESPYFFHLYFDAKTFFLIPKDNMNEEILHGFREILSEKIGNKR
jgi:hypothetical protein